VFSFQKETDYQPDLIIASQKCNNALVKTLLDAKTHVNKINKYREFPLLAALYNNPYIRSLIYEQLILFIHKYIDQQLIWNEISKNYNITIEIIEKNLDKCWDWLNISSNSFNGMYDEIQERYSSRLQLVQARNRMR
jgi:predicted DNA-binding protein YlxM (UPF0122 family)